VNNEICKAFFSSPSSPFFAGIPGFIHMKVAEKDYQGSVAGQFFSFPFSLFPFFSAEAVPWRIGLSFAFRYGFRRSAIT